MAKTFLVIAALSGLLAVIIGAFGAHGLKSKISEEMLAVYNTGVQYHFYHLLVLLVTGLLLLKWPEAQAFKIAGWLFIAGMLVFSGSLYILAITGIRWLGAITPLGGLAFIGGWLALAIGFYQNL